MPSSRPDSAIIPRPVGGGDSSLRLARGRDGLILAAALCVPILGATMSLEPGGGVSLPGFRGENLPTICVSRRLGLDCASCGMTRSIISLMHGDWRASLAFHRFGWLVALMILTQIPYRTMRLLCPRTRRPGLEAAGVAFLALAGALIVGNWLAGLIFGV